MIFAQSIGFVALALSVLLFQKNNRVTMLRLMMAASFLYTVHFFMLGAYTGSAMNALGLGRSYIYSEKNQKIWASSRIWPALFILMGIAFGYLTFEGLYSILPVIAVSFQTLVFWLNKTRMIRLLSLFSPPFWFAYNHIVGSIPGMIIEVLVFGSVCVAIYRFDIIARRSKTVKSR